MYSARSWPA